jgi:hypothetical protein
MYRVRQQGKVIETFPSFLDAWLYVYLELAAYARIIGPDGRWSINPGHHTVN